MKCNVGKTDKIIRWIIGLAIIAVGVLYKSWWGALGLIPIVTASISLCPIYSIFGLSTCKVESQEPKQD